MSQPTLVEFDLDRYLSNSQKVDLSEIEGTGSPTTRSPTATSCACTT
jgi:hypothetical protein